MDQTTTQLKPFDEMVSDAAANKEVTRQLLRDILRPLARRVAVLGREMRSGCAPEREVVYWALHDIYEEVQHEAGARGYDVYERGEEGE